MAVSGEAMVSESDKVPAFFYSAGNSATENTQTLRANNRIRSEVTCSVLVLRGGGERGDHRPGRAVGFQLGPLPGWEMMEEGRVGRGRAGDNGWNVRGQRSQVTFSDLSDR